MKQITFYIGYRIDNIQKHGVKFTTDKIENVLFIAENYPDYKSEKLFIETDTGIMTLEDFKTQERENGIKGIADLWSFLEKVRRTNKKEKSVDAVKNLFDALTSNEKDKLSELFRILSNKLSNALWEIADDYEEKNPDFYLSEDGMMDLIPHLITFGEKRVNTFFKKPHLALKVSEKEWEYDFDFYQAFLSHDTRQFN